MAIAVAPMIRSCAPTASPRTSRSAQSRAYTRAAKAFPLGPPAGGRQPDERRATVNAGLPTDSRAPCPDLGELSIPLPVNVCVSLAVDVAPMSNLYYQDCDPLTLDVANQPVIAHAVFPETSQFGTLQSLAKTAGVLEWRNAFA